MNKSKGEFILELSEAVDIPLPKAVAVVAHLTRIGVPMVFIRSIEDHKIEPEVEPTWCRIPDFDNYEISRVIGVRNRFTKRVLKVYVSATQNGPTTHVEMHDKDGFLRQISLDHLHQTIFDEKERVD